MPKFKDASGTEWKFEIDLEAIEIVLQCTEINLCHVLDNEGELLQRLADDESLLCKVMFALVHDGNTLQKFQRQFRGDSIDQAFDALVEGLKNFFPSRKRKVIESMLKRSHQFEELQEKAQSMLESMGPTEMLELVEKFKGETDQSKIFGQLMQMADNQPNGSAVKKRTKSAGKSAASSGSTRAS